MVNSQDPGASRCINKMQVKLFLNRGSVRNAAYDWSKIWSAWVVCKCAPSGSWELKLFKIFHTEFCPGKILPWHAIRYSNVICGKTSPFFAEKRAGSRKYHKIQFGGLGCILCTKYFFMVPVFLPKISKDVPGANRIFPFDIVPKSKYKIHF